RDDGYQTSDSYCSGSKPSTSQNCTGGSCTYSWKTGSWGYCGSNCKQTRTVWCERSDGKQSSDSYCSGNKPSTSQNCTGGSCTYSWKTGNWGNCGSNCQQTRTVWCERSDGTQSNDSNCSGSKPTTSQNCTSGSCTYSWKTGNWGNCGSDCKQTRTVWCERSDGTQSNDSNCSGSKPTTSQNCTDGSCTYLWKTGNWSICDNNCQQTRNVWCERSDGFKVNESDCLGVKPEIVQSCSGDNCSYSWKIDNWSICKSNCKQTRNVWCENSSGNQVNENFCSGEKPILEQNCEGENCITYDWHVEEWNSCDANCNQTRDVYCMNSKDIKVDEINCKETKPTNSQSCVGGLCEIEDNVWISPENSKILIKNAFDLNVIVDSGNIKLGSYQFEISFDTHFIAVDDTKGTKGVDIGEEGFLTNVNLNNQTGKIIINGFDTTGVGPGRNLNVIIIHFIAQDQSGSTNINLTVPELTDEIGQKIETPSVSGATVTILDVELGDVNGDSFVTIADALLVARYSAQLTVNNFIEDSADVNSDGKITIADALLIARKAAELTSWRNKKNMIKSDSAKVWMSPSEMSIKPEESFFLDIYVQSIQQKLGSYQFEIIFDQSVMNVNDQIGNSGVIIGNEGFLSVVNLDNSNGKIIINGFDTTGKGPGDELHLLRLNFLSFGNIETSDLVLTVSNLTNELAEDIEITNVNGATINFYEPSNIADLNNDGKTDLGDVIYLLKILVDIDIAK
ncbi:A disintegrin and metalloproteinase with thrombospondin motifs 9-like isoform, partial [Candidatus Magnetomorum sp. HK-1]